MNPFNWLNERMDMFENIAYKIGYRWLRTKRHIKEVWPIYLILGLAASFIWFVITVTP